jgi:hypothetical protein
MDGPACDVIGCGAAAQWLLVSELNGEVTEQNLCQRHWRQLMADKARRVIRWSRAVPKSAPKADVGGVGLPPNVSRT